MEFLDKTLIYQGETREINSDLETNINHLWPEEEKVTSVLLQQVIQRHTPQKIHSSTQDV